MRKYFIATILVLFAVSAVNAQANDSAYIASKDSLSLTQPQNIQTKTKKQFGNIDLSHRAGDHFMFQFGGVGWSGANSDFAFKGFSREFNAAFMLDKPFKTNPHYSLGFGLGYSSSNAFFNKKNVDIASSTTLTVSTTSNIFKKYKIVLTYAEIPLELRYSANMENPSKGFRFAVGLKGGLLLSAHSKGKDELNSSGTSLYGPAFIQKEYSKRFFNTTRIDGTMRVSYGLLSLYGTYQLTQLVKSGLGPVIHPYSIGLGISIM
ncbi:outer membrane beta-barrel protein [Arachidicoccus sp.]|uniref:outer membrane beta-barrel protein n=1 Tax=Arachidicoccus sp. TaxID=1872624 RepID=UPI003D253B6D